MAISSSRRKVRYLPPRPIRMRLALLVSSLAFATGLRLPTAASGQPNTWSRRAACCALPLAVLPLAATAATPLSASRVFSVREYVLDLKAARRGLDELTPLLERREPKTYEEARILLRKPPVNGVRKARHNSLNQSLQPQSRGALLFERTLTLARTPLSGCFQDPDCARRREGVAACEDESLCVHVAALPVLLAHAPSPCS